MNVSCYSTKEFEVPFINQFNNKRHNITFLPNALSIETASLAAGSEAIMIFAGDDASRDTLLLLKKAGVRFIAIKAAGYDNVDLKTAKELDIQVANVPAYSPHAIAEHTIAMIQALNRKIILADRQVHKYDFSVQRLIGTNLNGKTVGLIGTGKIGAIVARILYGYGCRILGYDVVQDSELTKKFNLEFVDIHTLLKDSDIISLHAPLTPHTKHLINKEKIDLMKDGVILINTARGGIINTNDAIEALKSGKIGHLGLDVYEKERGIFFYDHSKAGINDLVLQQLLEFENVLITPHQAFLTDEALSNIAETSILNLNCFEDKVNCTNELTGKFKI